MKVHEFDTIVKKLEMETRDTKDHHAWLVHNGITVARTKRSHGNNKYIPEDMIRKQLHVDKDQFAGLYKCSVDKPAYIKILIDKGIIAEEKGSVDNP